MKISLDSLAVLDAIVRKGTFAGAAEEMHRAPSAVTYVVQRLEDDLGIALFDRSGHRARLTEAGQALLREGRFLLRAAADVEARVRRVATGWEAELRIALDDIVPVEKLFPLLRQFFREAPGTRIRISAEVLGGSWDALLGGRADLSIAAPGDAPPEGAIATEVLGEFEFIFVVAPGHPLAAAEEPLSADEIQLHRAVAAADSSRTLPPRSSGLLDGQDTLTVPTLRAKLAAHIAGLGVGFLPAKWAAPHVRAGRLLQKRVAGPKTSAKVYLAWQPKLAGAALNWFLTRLREPAVKEYLFGDAPFPE
jgi:DNA-binding transcriptional LysR family regulator